GGEQVATLYSTPGGEAVFDGGPAISGLLQPELVERRRRLASEAATTVNSVIAERPLLIRRVASPDSVTVRMVNRVPWPVEAHITVDVAAACSTAWSDGVSGRLAAGQHVLERSVPPFALVECGFDAADVRVSGVRSTMPPYVEKVLKARLEDLKARDLSAPRLFEAGRNLSFEELDSDGRLVGWEAVVGEGAIRLTDEGVKDGTASILLQNPGGDSRVRLQTNPILPPETGQLAVTFYLRPDLITEYSRVVVRIEEVGGDYSSSTSIEAERLGAGALQFPDRVASRGEWRRPYAFAADDLPADRSREVRVVFEVAGESTLAIDQLELHELIFPLDLGVQATRQKLALLKLVREAESAFERRDFAECYTILDGYWPRFLSAYTPLLPEPETAVPDAVESESQVAQPSDATKDGPEDVEATETAAGWRSYLPKLWR
ncbi:MAG: hypothetical protein AAGG46_04910, partial [Planctomycetota bacterium]